VPVIGCVGTKYGKSVTLRDPPDSRNSALDKALERKRLLVITRPVGF
jgi:hypothetical protein